MVLGKYIDSNGLLSPNGEASGNGVLYSASFDIANGSKLFEEAILTKCFVEPGLLRRSPTNSDQEAFDDYLGAVSAYPKVADAVFKYGAVHGWVFDNDKKTNIRDWLGRSPAFVAHISLAAGYDPGILGSLAWGWSVAMAGAFNKDDQDAWTISAIMIRGNRAQNVITKTASIIYKTRLLKRWGTVANVYAKYFNDPEHPLVHAWGGQV